MTGVNLRGIGLVRRPPRASPLLGKLSGDSPPGKTPLKGARWHAAGVVTCCTLRSDQTTRPSCRLPPTTLTRTPAFRRNAALAYRRTTTSTANLRT